MDKLRMCDIKLNRITLKEIGDKISGCYILYKNDEGDCIPLYVNNPGRGWVDYEEDKDETPLKAIEQKIKELYKIKDNLRYDDIINIKKERVGKYLIFIEIFKNRECTLF